MRRIVCSMLVAGCGWVAGAASAAEPVQVMVLGAYHFGNPGLDMANAKADDVLLPARQTQLQEVAAGLAKFKPTRVAVEADADKLPQRALPSYRAYLAGERRDKRNEIDQIAFRVAQAQGHAEVYGIDVDGDFPFEAVEKFAKEHAQGEALQGLLDRLNEHTRAFEAAQARSTIGQLLRTMNDPAEIRRDHGFYMAALHFGQAADQPGAALAAGWYARNLGICARLVQLARPGDRLLVLYGAGHNYLLRHCVEATPGWQLVEANDYLPK